LGNGRSFAGAEIVAVFLLTGFGIEAAVEIGTGMSYRA
jgi:hypothetical protein